MGGRGVSVSEMLYHESNACVLKAFLTMEPLQEAEYGTAFMLRTKTSFLSSRASRYDRRRSLTFSIELAFATS
jgi:hypothetical protein